MKTNEKTVIHDSLSFQEFTVSIKLPREYKPLHETKSKKSTKTIENRNNMADSVPFKLLKPRLLQAKDVIKIEVFKSGSLINLLLGLIRCTTVR